jgi:hypothetical protein
MSMKMINGIEYRIEPEADLSKADLSGTFLPAGSTDL